MTAPSATTVAAPGVPVANRDGDLGGYLAAVGAATITEAAGVPAALAGQRHNSLTLDVVCPPEQLATAISRHARTHAHGHTWLWDDHTDGRPLFSTLRTTGRRGDAVDWQQLETARRRVTAQLGPLDRQMTAGLGWPRVWAGVEAAGTSPLDTAPRNAGRTVVHRLRNLAGEVAGLTPDELVDDLTGRDGPAPGDLPGGWQLRWTPNGMTPVRAWCALWALTAFPVTRSGARARIPAHARRPEHGEWLALPGGWTRPMPLRTWRMLVASPALRAAAFRTGRGWWPDAGNGYDPLWQQVDKLGLAYYAVPDPESLDGLDGWSLVRRVGVPGLLVWTVDEWQVGPAWARSWAMRPARLPDPVKWV